MLLQQHGADFLEVLSILPVQPLTPRAKQFTLRECQTNTTCFPGLSGRKGALLRPVRRRWCQSLSVGMWGTPESLTAALKSRSEPAQAQPLTQGPVREAVHELQVGREGEDVEEMEEDVHSNDGPHVEEGVDPDVPHLIVFASELSGAHLPGWQTGKGLS